MNVYKSDHWIKQRIFLDLIIWDIVCVCFPRHSFQMTWMLCCSHCGHWLNPSIISAKHLFYKFTSFFFICFDCTTKNKKLTGFKLDLRLLSKLAPGEREAVPGPVRLLHRGPVDGGENWHQHPQQGTYERKHNQLTWSKQTWILMDFRHSRADLQNQKKETLGKYIDLPNIY